MVDQSIRHVQHLDLIYSQSNTLYDIIPNSPCKSNATSTQKHGTHTDGIISATFEGAIKQLSDHISQSSVDPSTKLTVLPTTAINSMQSTKKPGGKDKKNKKNTTHFEEQSTK